MCVNLVRLGRGMPAVCLAATTQYTLLIFAKCIASYRVSKRSSPVDGINLEELQESDDEDTVTGESRKLFKLKLITPHHQVGYNVASITTPHINHFHVRAVAKKRFIDIISERPGRQSSVIVVTGFCSSFRLSSRSVMMMSQVS